MDSNTTIRDALAYYDKQNQESIIKQRKFKYYKINFNTSEIQLNTNKNSTDMAIDTFEVVGMYNNRNKSWIWGWSLYHLKNEQLFLSRSILNHGLDIDIGDKNNITNVSLKIELTTSRFRIQNRIQLDIHLAIFLYLSKKKIILPIKITENTLKNINEINKIDLDIGENDVIYYIIIMGHKL